MSQRQYNTGDVYAYNMDIAHPYHDAIILLVVNRVNELFIILWRAKGPGSSSGFASDGVFVSSGAEFVRIT